MSIAHNIKKLREDNGMSQKEFAKIAGVSDKAVSTWEKGTSVPRMATIQKIADYFGVLKINIIENNNFDNKGDFIIKSGKIIRYEDLPEDGQKELESFFQYLKQKYKL